MKLTKEQTQWHRNVLVAVSKVTSWAVTWRMIDALEAAVDGADIVKATGSDDGYNWAVDLYEKDGHWVVSGSCGYGSGCHAEPNWITFNTCGGHSVTATRLEGGGTIFQTDVQESFQSWGELVYDDTGDYGKFADYTQGALERHRVGLIRDQFNK